MAGPGLIIKKRMILVLGAFSLAVLALLLRLAWLQIIDGEWYQKMAFEQQTRGRIISPKRGTIFDRNLNPLAVSASVETISVSPADIKQSKQDPEKISRKLSEILNMDYVKVYKKVTARSRYEIIKKKVEKTVGDVIRKWRLDENIKGVYIDEDSKRYYPHRNLAAQVIGFTGTDNQGLDGIEMIMEKYLKGVPGKILSEVDAGGREMPFNEEKHIEAQDGLSVVLTIDETIQHIADKAITKAISDYKVSEGATAVVLDPRDGGILALVSKPDYDLNDPFAAPPGIDKAAWKGNTPEGIKKLQETVWRNKAVSDTYEPGSTFKAITAAAGLEENVIKPDSPVTDATVIVGGWPINCWRPNAHGNETFTKGVYNSCNPVFVRLAQSLGIDRFYKYVRAFGFYDKTNIELPGEAQSIIHKSPTEVNMATASFGQRFQISPIQLITAYGAIANGGKLYRPHIVKEFLDSEGNKVKDYEPAVLRNVISKQTSDTLKQILEGVVSEGTGGNAFVKGYRLAGKTGTSETLQTKKTGRYIASFMSFAPADNPVVCVLVILDHPNVYPHTGGMIAAPVAGKLMEDVLTYLEVDRRYAEGDIKDVFVPEVRGKSIDDARKSIKDAGLEIEEIKNGDGSAVIDQMPKPGAMLQKGQSVIVYTGKAQKAVMVQVPDLSNETIGEAQRSLNNLGLNINISGLGVAVKQNVSPGKMVPKGQIIEVEFKNTEFVD